MQILTFVNHISTEISLQIDVLCTSKPKFAFWVTNLRPLLNIVLLNAFWEAYKGVINMSSNSVLLEGQRVS